MTMLLPESAVETFVRGFTFTRSFTHPYLAERIGPAWVMRDGPRRGKAKYRTEEWIVSDEPAAEIDRLARAHTRGRFTVCAITAGDGVALRAEYKAAGYRLNRTEALMVHDLTPAPPRPCDAEIRRVESAEVAAQLAASARSTQLLSEHLAKASPLRAYVARTDGQVVGWVRSVSAGRASWCASMQVEPAFRRRGIASALMQAMLADDRKAGHTASVLLASHTGATLYPTLGFTTIGTLYLFTPRER